MKKKLVASGIIAFGLIGVQSSAYAATIRTDISVPNAPAVEAVQSVTEKTPVLSDVRLSKLIATGGKSINERVAKLTALKTKIQAGKLTDAQKQSLGTSIDSEVTALNTVLANIKAATSTTDAKALDTSVYTDYRVYAVFIPQTRILAGAYAQENHLAKLNDTFTKDQSVIDAKKAVGADVSALQVNLDSAKTLAGTLSGQVTDIETKAGALKPADYPTVSKATVKALNEGLKSVTASFKKISTLLKSKTKI